MKDGIIYNTTLLLIVVGGVVWANTVRLQSHRCYIQGQIGQIQRQRHIQRKPKENKITRTHCSPKVCRRRSSQEPEGRQDPLHHGIHARSLLSYLKRQGARHEVLSLNAFGSAKIAVNKREIRVVSLTLLI